MEAAWIAVIAAGVTGFLVLIGGRFAARDADRRLQKQLDHEAQQRREAQILAVRLDSLDNLKKLIGTTQSAMPFVVGRSSADITDATLSPVLIDLQRALASMKALQEQDALDEVMAVVTVIRRLSESETAATSGAIAIDLSDALGTLERRYNALKEQAIRAPS